MFLKRSYQIGRQIFFVIAGTEAEIDAEDVSVGHEVVYTKGLNEKSKRGRRDDERY